jgi:hypothetical protein
MQTAYLHLVRHFLAKGCTVSVFDGEEWQVKKSTGYREIVEAIKSVEEAELVIRNDGVKVGWALVSPYGLSPDETVINHTDNADMEAWWQAFDKTEAK